MLASNAERGAVIAELGAPVATDDGGDRLTDTYSYTDAGKVNSLAGKSVRILLYTAGPPGESRPLVPGPYGACFGSPLLCPGQE